MRFVHCFILYKALLHALFNFILTKTIEVSIIILFDFIKEETGA